MEMTSISEYDLSKIAFHPFSDDPEASHHLIFFITGNPGLVAYYSAFLSTLHELLANTFRTSTSVVHIYSQSLAGFEDTDSPPSEVPYSLEEEISYTLAAVTSQRIPSGPQKGQPYSSVFLIGHSVGAYILLEIIQKLRRSASTIRIRAGILLFPTITHIAASPSGVKITALFRIPDFPRRASIVVKALVGLAPRSFLKWVVGVVTKMPDDAAEVTTRFLTSRNGVWQALHLAKHEMEKITEDRWDEDIWGIEHADEDEDENEVAEAKAQSVPKLIFYFGENDHWVANHTRDALIAARGREEGGKQSSKPIMLIDDRGIDHGFCIHHSESVAEKVKVWIEEIITENSE